MRKLQIARRVWPPQPGFFRMRLVPRGWAVPARIFHLPDDTWMAVIDGQECAPDADPALAQDVARIWHSGLHISPQEYEWLNRLREAALERQPDHPAAQPRRPIIVANLRPLYPRTPIS